MDRIFVRSDFADRAAYRLVSMDDAWVKAFSAQYSTPTPPPHRASSPRKRHRPVDSEAAVTVAFVMKGDDQLCLHDATTTRTVRRVEYSNVMMLAKRRFNATGRAAMAESGVTPSAADMPARKCNDSVVVASLVRMFDSHAAHPQRNLLATLADSHITIDDLEHDALRGEEEQGKATTPRGYTFAELARGFGSSPAELSALLQQLGAVVHRGRVRLLQPALVYEALTAALTYFDAAEASELTWSAVRAHLCPSVYPAVVLRSLEAVYGANAEDSNSEGVEVGGLPGVLHVSRLLLGLAGGIFDTAEAVTQRTLSSGATAQGLPLEDFTASWWDSIPSSLFGTAGVPSRTAADAEELFLGRLRGWAIVEPRVGGNGGGGGRERSQGTLWWLPKDVLPNDFAARLAALFEVRPQRWNQQDLKAYMEPLLAPDQNFQHIIVRFVREYRIPGQVVQYAPLT